MSINVLHIGVGIRGRHWLEFVNDYPDAVTVACVDSDDRALSLVKRKFGENHCKYFTEIGKAFESINADAAIIATPSMLHAEHARKALEAGLAVMIEKPLASSVEEAKQLIRLSENMSKPIMVAENYRFWPAMRTVRKLVEDNVLGEISEISITDRRHMPSHTEGPWLAGMEYPQLQEIAIHHFDCLRSFLDRQPKSISARVWNPWSSDYKHGACTEAQIEMDGGVHVQYLGTLISHRFSHTLLIEGERGTLWTNQKYVFLRRRGKWYYRPVRLVKVPSGDEARYPRRGTTSLLNGLMDAIVNRQIPETSAYDNIWTLAMVEAGKLSNRERRLVSINEILKDPITVAHDTLGINLSTTDGMASSRQSSIAVKKGSIPRVLIIGLDTADADLIDRWCTEGFLPALESLRKQGLWGQLNTTAEIMHVSAWPSIYTGTKPGKHGMYHAYQVKAGERGIHRTRTEEYAQFPFWKFLDDAGRRCIVMDAFMDLPIERFGGIQILEYGTWTWYSDPGATPGKVWKEIVSRFGPYPAPEHGNVLQIPEPWRFRERLIKAAEVKGKIARWLLKTHPWDMLFVTFSEPHPAGHYLWHLTDPEYPAHQPQGIAGLEHSVRDVYVAVDTAIGEILRELDDSVTVVVTSGDGMGPNYSGSHLMPEVLNRLGLYYGADVGKQIATGRNKGGDSNHKRNLLSAIRRAMPLSLRHRVTRCLPHSLKYKLKMKLASSEIDWTNSKAFCIPNTNEGYIRINRKGREPQGIVEDGSEYSELVTEIYARLQELVNPQNGLIATSRVVFTDDVFPGNQRQNLPDIVVKWDIDAKVLSELGSERVRRVSKAACYDTTPCYTGNHRAAAFVIARGPRIPENYILTAGHIVDIAPTVLAMLGVGAPDHFDGHVWNELVK